MEFKRLYKYLILVGYILVIQSVTSSILAQTNRFVNDNSISGDIFTTTVGNDANPGTANAPYATLSYALSVSNAGDIIYVDAGSYVTPDLVLNKSISILGPNYGITANDPTNPILVNPARNAEANIIGSMMTIASSDIRIKGLSFTPGSKVQFNQPNDALNFSNIEFWCNLFDISSTERTINLTGKNMSSLSSANYIIVDNRFTKSLGASGIAISLNFIINAHLTRNTFTIANTLLARLHSCISIGNTGNVDVLNIVGNVFDRMNGPITTVRIGRAEILANKVYDCRLGFTVQNIGTGASEVLVRDNQFFNIRTGVAMNFSRNGGTNPSLVNKFKFEINYITIDGTGQNASGIVNASSVSTTESTEYSVRFNTLIYTGDFSSFTTSPYAIRSIGQIGKINIENNDIQFNGLNLPSTTSWNPPAAGILVYSKDGIGNNLPPLSTISIKNNKVTKWYESVSFFDPTAPAQHGGLPPGAVVDVNENSFTNDFMSINAGSSGPSINASCNWYGTLNAAQVLSKLSPTVNPTPWLTNGTDINGFYGFQPDLISCTGTPPLVVSLQSLINMSCYNSQDGSIDITVSGGSLPFTFAWSKNGIPGYSTNEDLQNLTAGNYSVTIIDNNSQTATLSNLVITQPSPLLVTISATNLNCFEDNSGSATAAASGGTGPVSYLWNTGATTQTIYNLPSGTYSVVVTDDNDCTANTSAIVSQPNVLTASVSSSPASGYQVPDGSAQVLPTGGTSPYSYAWNNSIFTNVNSAILPGNYSVVVTDNNGCNDSRNIIVGTTEPLALSITKNDVSCRDGNNGAASVSMLNGLAPFVYLWSTGATTASINNLSPGNYSLTVTDAIGNIASGTITISQPATALSVTISGTSVLCFGNNSASASATVIGGTAPYTYLWSNGATTQTISGIGVGNYSVIVTDAGSCSATSSFNVTAATNITINTAITNATCPNNNNGKIVISATGGLSPYTYSLNGGNFVGNNSFNNLIPAQYNVSVKDAQGCINTIFVDVLGQPKPLITIDNIVSPCTGSNNGSIYVTASGGGAPFTYFWSRSPGFTSTQEDLINVIAGTYTLTVKNIYNCSTTISVTLSALPPVSITGIVTNAACFGGTGSVNITPAGGTGTGYTYSWTGPNGFTSTSEDITNVPAGTYSVVVRDSRNCGANKSFFVTQPGDMTVTFSGINVSCYGGNNGSATANPSNGVPPYTYLWSTGATSRTINNLSAGSYIVTVTSSNNCQKSSIITITQPNPLTAVITGTPVSCNGGNNGSATVSVTGGTLPYTILWNNGSTASFISNLSAGNYSVIVTDFKGCTTTAVYTVAQPPVLTASAAVTNVSCNAGNNGSITANVVGGNPPYTYAWSNGRNTQIISGLGAGNYTVVVTDTKGCTANTSATITQPTQLTATLTGVNASCFGTATAAASAFVSGGTAPYSYLWSNGSTASSITNVVAGSYQVQIKDANNCTLTKSITLTSPTAITISASTTNQACGSLANGTITLNATGGTPPYRYSLDGITYTPGNLFNGLLAGGYTVYVKDNNNCIRTATVMIAQNTGLLVSLASLSPSSFELANGSINITVTRGSGAYTFNWTGPGGFVSNNEDLSGLIAGNYTVSVSGGPTCNGSLTVTVHQLTALQVSGISTNVACRNDNNGTVNLSVNGGLAPYTFAWTGPNNFSASTEDLSNLRPGTYSVTVTDGKGIVKTANFVILESASQLNLTTTQTTITQCGGTSTITISASGGAPPYLYKVDNGGYQNSNVISGITAGSHTAYVKDSYGCIKSVSASVIDNGNDKYELNNNLNQAASMESSYRYYYANARIGAANDVDWFNFYTQAGGSSNGNWQNVTVTVTHPSQVYNFDIYSNLFGQWAQVAPYIPFTTTQKKYLVPTGQFNSVQYKLVISGPVSNTCYSASVQLGSLQNSFGVIIGKSNSEELPPGTDVPELFVNTYPNPHTGNFDMKIETTSGGPADIQLWNMLGQKISDKPVILNQGQNIIQFRNMRESILYYKIIIGKEIKTGKIIGPE